MLKFVSYLRVSTQKQGYAGLGIEAQRAAVEQYVRSVGGMLLEEHVEVETGSRKERPVLVKSIAQCRKQKATLLIARLDRLARNVAFISELMEGGVEFLAVDAPYANRLMIHILAAFAEHERSLISERTRLALAAAKSRGVKLGANGAVLAEKQKQDASEFAQTLDRPVRAAIGQGADTLLAVATYLNREGFRTRENATWSPSGVQRLLRRLELRTPAMVR